MNFKGIYYSLTFRLALAIGLTAALTYLALAEEWGWFLFLGIGWLAALRGISLLFKRNAQKVAFMFDAIDNSDYAFKYVTRGRSSNDKLVSDLKPHHPNTFSSESRGDPEREILRVDHEPSEYGYHRRR